MLCCCVLLYCVLLCFVVLCCCVVLFCGVVLAVLQPQSQGPHWLFSSGLSPGETLGNFNKISFFDWLFRVATYCVAQKS